MRGLSNSKAAIVMIALAAVLISTGATIRVLSDHQQQSSTPASAEVVDGVAPSTTAKSPTDPAVTTPPRERDGNGFAGAVVGFGLLAVWLMIGLVMVARSRRARQASEGTLG